MAVWVGLAAWSSNAYVLSGMVVLFLIISLAGRQDLGKSLWRLGSLTIALLPAWLVLPFFGDGGSFQLNGSLSFHDSGLSDAALLQLRASAVLLAVMLHQGSTQWSRWVWAAGKLGAPSSLLNLFTVTLRYLPVLEEEGRRTMTAARARGFSPTTGRHSYRILASIAGAGMVRSFKRSDRLYRAMLARGYRGKFHPLQTHSLGGRELAFSICSALVAAAAVAYSMGIAP